MKRYTFNFEGRQILDPLGGWVRFNAADDEITDRDATIAQLRAALADREPKLILLRTFLQKQIAECKQIALCESCDALRVLLDATKPEL